MRLARDVRAITQPHRSLPRREAATLLAAGGFFAILVFAVLGRPMPGEAPPTAPNIWIAVHGSEFVRGEPLTGDVTVAARDATRVSDLRVLIYPEGVPHQPGNVVVALTPDLAPTELGMAQSARVPFSWDQRAADGTDVPRGSYVLVAAGQVSADRANEHLFATVGSTTSVTLR